VTRVSQSVPRERLQQLWNRTIDEIKKGEVNLALWEALEACVPLAFEAPMLILGIRSEDFHRSGHLTTPLARHEIRQILTRLGGQEIDFDVISGDTPEAWEGEKERRAKTEDALRALADKATSAGEGALRNWDDAGVRLQQLFSGTKERAMPWVAADYAVRALDVILTLEREQRAASDADDHAIDRGVARMLQKIAGQVEVPVNVVGLEYRRRKIETEP
jgi:hypothetical protein